MMHALRRWPLLVAILTLCAFPPVAAADGAPTGRQYALLVGVRNYNKEELHSLRFTESDVADLAQILRDAGYKRVVLMTQTEANKGDNDLLPLGDNIRRQLKALLDDGKPGDTMLVAFSGHGVQFRDDKASYFCPMDARLEDLKTLVSLVDVYKALEDCPAGMKVLLADCCRNDPQAEASKDVGKEKLESKTRPQAVPPPGGVAALFSCSEGQRSYESEKLGHGVFFHYVIEGLKGSAPANKKGEVGLEGLAQYVKDEVPNAVKDVSIDARQQPQLVSNLSGAVPLVRERTEITNTVGMRLKLIRPGTFTMGSRNGEEGGFDKFDKEWPRHKVEIAKTFYMGVYPVTWGQFAAFIKDDGYQTDGEKDGKGGYGLNRATADWEQKAKYTWRHPGFTQGDDHPVVEVSWNDATAFCAWLSKKEGKTYELPTEAEWEYACRAGTKTRYWCGDKDEDLKGNANIADASLKEKSPGAAWAVAWDDGYAFTSPVGHFKANPWGLYDMGGNVWQWCADGWGPYQGGSINDPNNKENANRRVWRGGSWYSAAGGCRSAFRAAEVPALRIDCGGFRVVLRPSAKTP